MDLYATTSYELAERLTKRYSTSFSLSSSLFDRAIRHHIYAIYGMVRIADEVVDTYRGGDAATQLDSLERDVMAAIASGYSTNPILHAFALTARQYSIDDTLIHPFFESMAVDLTATTFTQEEYARYIYGSAEVVGLMCLRVFVLGDEGQYQAARDGAQRLGAAYQKVNFLRDMKADYDELGRVYFPGVSYDDFDEAAKQAIIADIEQDFAVADRAIDDLPPNSRAAVRASYYYYHELLQQLKATSAETLKNQRIRVPNWRKLALLAKAKLGA